MQRRHCDASSFPSFAPLSPYSLLLISSLAACCLSPKPPHISLRHPWLSSLYPSAVGSPPHCLHCLPYRIHAAPDVAQKKLVLSLLRLPVYSTIQYTVFNMISPWVKHNYSYHTFGALSCYFHLIYVSPLISLSPIILSRTIPTISYLSPYLEPFPSSQAFPLILYLSSYVFPLLLFCISLLISYFTLYLVSLLLLYLVTLSPYHLLFCTSSIVLHHTSYFSHLYLSCTSSLILYLFPYLVPLTVSLISPLISYFSTYTLPLSCLIPLSISCASPLM